MSVHQCRGTAIQADASSARGCDHRHVRAERPVLHFKHTWRTSSVSVSLTDGRGIPVLTASLRELQDWTQWSG